MYNPGVDNQITPGYPQPAGYPPPQAAGYPPPQPAFNTNQTSNTTVIIQQPQQAQVVVRGRESWSSGICSCFENMNLCLIGLFCPAILPCVVSCKANECCCVGVMCPIALRASIRERYNIKGDIVGDCCTLYCCPLCAFCQMGRETDFRR